MTMKVRRIVTGHNANGKAIIKTNEQVTAVPRVDAGISGCEIWSTDQMPIDNSSVADAAVCSRFDDLSIAMAAGPADYDERLAKERRSTGTDGSHSHHLPTALALICGGHLSRSTALSNGRCHDR